MFNPCDTPCLMLVICIKITVIFHHHCFEGLQQHRFLDVLHSACVYIYIQIYIYMQNIYIDKGYLSECFWYPNVSHISMLYHVRHDRIAINNVWCQSTLEMI